QLYGRCPGCAEEPDDGRAETESEGSIQPVHCPTPACDVRRSQSGSRRCQPRPGHRPLPVTPIGRSPESASPLPLPTSSLARLLCPRPHLHGRPVVSALSLPFSRTSSRTGCVPTSS